MIHYYWRALLIAGCNLALRAPRLPHRWFLTLLLFKLDCKYAQDCEIRRAVLKAMK